MRFFKYLICVALFSLSLILSSCEPEIDLSADAKDVTISYGILNMNDTIHYFKIYKGYLTDENAFVQASNWENIYYNVDSIEVHFEEYNASGTLMRTAVLDTTTRIQKEEGFFAHPKQLLYYSNWKLNPECKYRLTIKNVNSGREVYAESVVVGDFRISKPLNDNPFNSRDNRGSKFECTKMREANVAMCDFYIYFHYLEVNNATGQRTHKVISQKMNTSHISPNTDGTVEFSNFTPRDLYLMMIKYIKEDKNVTRYVDAIDGRPYYCMEVEVWAADKTFRTYCDVSTPSASVVQNRLEYTNFVSEDGLAFGILASRNKNQNRKLLKFDNSSGNNNEDSLVKGQYTKNLNFDYYRNSPEFIEN